MAKISLIRHGEAKYEDIERKTSFHGAYDLKEEGIKNLVSKAHEFINKINPSDRVIIWSSPIPRALETGNIFEDELNKAGISVEYKKIFKVFEEVRGFKWQYLQVLVDGGIIEHEGVEYCIDKEITNPNNYSYHKYFKNGCHKDINKKYLDELGPIGEVFFDTETYSNVFSRILKEINRLSKINHQKTHILIFTHQCCTDFLVELLNGYRYGGISPGENITLEGFNGDFNVIDFPQFYSVFRSQKIILKTKSRIRGALDGIGTIELNKKKKNNNKLKNNIKPSRGLKLISNGIKKIKGYTSNFYNDYSINIFSPNGNKYILRYEGKKYLNKFFLYLVDKNENNKEVFIRAVKTDCSAEELTKHIENYEKI